MQTHKLLPHQLAEQPPSWIVQWAAFKKMWLRHIQEGPRNQKLTTDKARNIANNCEEWKRVINNTWIPVAPAAVYWLRGQSAP